VKVSAITTSDNASDDTSFSVLSDKTARESSVMCIEASQEASLLLSTDWSYNHFEIGI
jgi:hypothetical protein